VRRIAFLATVLLLTGCATAEEPPAAPHGYVEGAEETAEAQTRLVLADDDGAVRVLDLITEEVTELGPVDGVDAIRGDGRYAHLTDGDAVHVVDSGGWMVDHGDHVHYYRTEPRMVQEAPDPVEAPCPQASAPRETRRGTVFACADGAILVDDGTSTEIPYPATQAPPAPGLTHRSGSTTLVGISAGHGVWVLDVTAKTWTLVETGPVVAANTAGEGTPLLTLTADGVLHAHDIATGAETASTPLLKDPAGTPVIEVDPSRAYVNDQTGQQVHEIDYNDDLRVARTFPLDIAPAHMVETGR
jgi:hypothetical protein